MKRNWYSLAVAVLHFTSIAFSQPKSEILGSWILSSSYETPDVLIIRSDHQYFVYNSNCVNPESLGLKDSLYGRDIIINESYTTVTEIGKWIFNDQSHELTLINRCIIHKESDFVQAYGEKDGLSFNIKHLSRDKIELCYLVDGIHKCDIYERNWSYLDAIGNKIFYTEKETKISDTGNRTKEIILSGYETELHLNYIFYGNNDKLMIRDNHGKLLYSACKMESTCKWINEDISLSGVTKLIVEVVSSELNSTWVVDVEIK